MTKPFATVTCTDGVYCVTTEPNNEATLAGLAKYTGRQFGLFKASIGSDEWHFANIDEVCNFLRYRESVKRARVARGAIL